jgi:redox-sensitive bicupin YhaK (pirin superfamily)
MRTQANNTAAAFSAARLGGVISPLPRAVGSGFKARHFAEGQPGASMTALLMVDDFVMTVPTFPPHLHAGMSVVTALFEDTEGSLLNRDTLGCQTTLHAGDLYWLTAASGVVHEEHPAPGARVHGMQILIDLPARLKGVPARAMLVRAVDVPVLDGVGCRVRVVLGVSGSATGAQNALQEVTMLDGSLHDSGRFQHPLPLGRDAWIYAVSGQLTVSVQGESHLLEPGQATSVSAGTPTVITVGSDTAAHFVLLSAWPAGSPYVIGA